MRRILRFGFVLCLSVFLILPFNAKAQLLNGRISQLDFRDISVGDALRILSEESNLNVVASQQATGIKMTMYLKDIAPVEVLDAMAKTYNLWYRKDPVSNIYRIYTAEEFRLGNVETNREHVKVFTARYQNVISIAYALENLYPERVQMQIGQEQNEQYQDLQSRFQKFQIMAQQSMVDVDLGGGGGNSGGGVGGGMGGSGQSGNNRNNSNRGGGRGGQLSQGNQMSLLQNQRLEGNLQGVITGDVQGDGRLSKFIQEDAPIFVTLLKTQNKILVRTRDPVAIAEIERLIGELDQSPINVLLEVKILSVNLNDDYTSTFNFIYNGSGNLNVGRVDINATDIISDGVVTAGDLIRGALGDPSIVAGYMSKTFKARLKILEDEGRITELASPVVSTANQEVSRITLGDERPITTGFTTSTVQEAGDNGNTNNYYQTKLIPETDLQQIGTNLVMTPSVSKDNSVNLNLLIDQSAISVNPGTIPVETATGITDVPVDVVSRKSFAGNVIIENEKTMVIGGLITEKAMDVESKVPVLGDIPLLGFFFNNQNRERLREELIIMIKPHIIRDNRDMLAVSGGYLNDNSVHPAAKEFANLGVYDNPDGEHRSYQLQPDYKTYSPQDKMDPQHWDKQNLPSLKAPPKPSVAGDAPASGTGEMSVSEKQQIYIKLTQYAAQAIRKRPEEREIMEGVAEVQLDNNHRADLLYDTRIRAVPMGSWRQGGIHVTAVAVYNLSSTPLSVDFKHIKGQWLASSVETATLKKQGDLGDSTYMYLISAGRFDDVMNRIQSAGL